MGIVRLADHAVTDATYKLGVPRANLDALRSDRVLDEAGRLMRYWGETDEYIDFAYHTPVDGTIGRYYPIV